MKRIKLLKKIITFALVIIMCSGAGTSVMAAESKTSLPDGWENLEVSEEQLKHLNNEIQLRGSAPGLSSLTITDLTLDENNEIHIEVKVMGTAKGIYYSDSVSGTVIHAQAQATNAMMPWNTLTTTNSFTIP